MNLVVDYGNTSIKFGLFKDSKLEKAHTVQTFDLKEIISEFNVDNVLVSSVRDKSLPDTINSKTKVLVLDNQTSVPVINLYNTPETLGTDRLAGAVGANFLFPMQHCLIIDAGTCITYDFIDKEGKYHGGSISPGLYMRFQALHNFTSRLPLIEKSDAPALIGKNTRESIQSGVINGTTAEINGIIQQYKSIYTDLKIILCGGDTKFFENRIKESIFASPDLILIGLNRILEHNVSKKI